MWFKSLEKVLNLQPIPIAEKYSDTPFYEEAQRFPIDLYNCMKCKCIQVLDNIDQNFYGQNTHIFLDKQMQ